MILRPYQSICLDAIDEALAIHPSVLAVLATGLGKTVIFAHLAARWPGRVLVLAHRDELIRQAAEKLALVSGEEVGIEMGEARLDENQEDKIRLVVSSVQTMCRPKRQQKFDPSAFGLLIVDEAHHAVARTYRDVIAYFRQNPATRVLGVTATPKRADELAMGQVFDNVCFDYGILQAVEDGWLVPVQQQAVVVEGLDFSRVRDVAGDFSEAQLEQILTEEKMLHKVAAPTVELIGPRPALVFCVTVMHARLMALVLERYRGGGVVASLDGSTPFEERRATVEAYKRGKIQILCNCALFLEGFDAPATAAVVMARPTKSLPLYTQVLGRGTRPLPGLVDGLVLGEQRREAIAHSAKPDLLVLDFVGNSGNHKIVTATDLLGGKYAAPVRQYARQTLEEERQPISVEEALARAQDELLLLAEIDERRRNIKAVAEYHTRHVSPFAPGRGPVVREEETPPPLDPPTDKQVWFLVRRLKWRESDARRLSKRQASAIIGKAKDAEAQAAGGAKAP
jgi:superfamily II DNA or RNA helicase